MESEKITKLISNLTAWSEAYYAGKPMVSDPVYDAAELELRTIDPGNSYFGKVGSNKVKESTFEKVKHETPMLSLNKAYSLDEVLSWRKNTEGVVMPKMDGFAISLIYELSFENDEFVLTRGVTRGGGDCGEDVTENIMQINDIPHTIPCLAVDNNFNDKFEVRGEVYMKHSVFASLDIEAENCRNIAPGSVRQKDPSITKSRKLNFFAYNLLGTLHDSMSERLDALNNIGFQRVSYIKVNLNDNSAIEAAYRHYVNYRSEFDFDIDGVVFMIDRIDLIDALGNTSHHPRGAIAWKFEAEEGETTFTGYQWQVSRTGLVNPVGMFEGIRLDGATLSQATLHNLSIVKSLNLSAGDKIVVSRRGGVIPKIEKLVKKVNIESVPEIPAYCPVCGSGLETHKSKDGIETLHCVNLDSCPAQVLTRILHFISAMEIMDVGESLVSKMIDAGFVKTCFDLFTVRKDQLLMLESVLDKTADRTLSNIEAAKKKPLSKFLEALGIKGLGSSISETIASKFKTLECVTSATSNDFKAIDGISDITADSIVKGLQDNAHLISNLASVIEIIPADTADAKEGCLSGKSFLITGTLSQPRGYFEKLISEKGGVIKSGVSKALDYLIVGDDAGSKLDKAKKVGVTIINEIEFMNMLE